MAYKALDIAKYIVTKCKNDGNPISNLQLQKILYYIQKEFLQSNNGEVAFDDQIEAWQFGPVVPNVYYEFCGYGAMTILSEYEVNHLIKKDQSIIDKIVEEKRTLNPWDMVEETHKPGGAWDQAYKNGNKSIIDVDLIRSCG